MIAYHSIAQWEDGSISAFNHNNETEAVQFAQKMYKEHSRKTDGKLLIKSSVEKTENGKIEVLAYFSGQELRKVYKIKYQKVSMQDLKKDDFFKIIPFDTDDAKNVKDYETHQAVENGYVNEKGIGTVKSVTLDQIDFHGKTVILKQENKELKERLTKADRYIANLHKKFKDGYELAQEYVRNHSTTNN